MARATNKSDLLSNSETNYNKLNTLIDSFTVGELNGEFPFEDRDRNIRDVIVHLYEWHLMMENWYSVGMRGEKPDIPAKGYTWKTLPALNMVIWQKYQK